MAVIRKHEKSIRRLKNFLLVCISGILTFLCAELALSQFSHLGKKEEKIWIKTEMVWGSCYTSNPEGYFPIETTDPLTTTPLYCITYDYGTRKAGYFPQHKLQAVIVGDSFAFGEGLKEADTLGYVLGERFKDFNFQNYSVPGTDIAYIYRKVYAVIKGVKDVKAIVYFYNLNDLLSAKELQEAQNAIFDMQNIRWDEMKNNPGPVDRFWAGSTVLGLLRKAWIFNAASRRTIRNYHDMYFGSRNRHWRKQSVDLLRAMNTLAASNNIKFYVVIYPLFYKDIFGRYPFERIHDFLKDVCAANQIACVDAYEPFKGDHSLERFIVHPVDYHPNGLANRLIADFLYRQKDFLSDDSEMKSTGNF